MTEDTYQQKWLEEKFGTLNEKIDVIDAGVKKMNGKVADHEKAINDMKIAGVQHILDCPVVAKLRIVRDDHDKRIKALEDNNLEYNFFKKYPKAGIILILSSVFVLVFSVYSATRKIVGNDVTDRVIDKIEQNK